MKYRICAVVPAETAHDLTAMLEKAEKAEPDFIEIRMDYLAEDFKSKDVRKLTDIPLIATNRPRKEGGLFEGPESKRIDLLLRAAKDGFDFVDIELMPSRNMSLVEKINSMGVKTIVSFHNFTSTPSLSEMRRIFQKMLETEADVCKIVTKARSVDDNLSILRFVREASKESKVVSFCMGKLGISSRILSPIFGAFFTYASLERGRESAEGQLTIDEIRAVHSFLGVK